MSYHYDPKCSCSECRAYRRANDYRATCDCVDCTTVRAETCPTGKGRVGSCDVRGRDAYTASRPSSGCGCGGSFGCG